MLFSWAISWSQLELSVDTILTDGFLLIWSLGTLIGIVLLVILAGGKVVTPLGCWLGKWIGVPLGFKICNTMGVVLGLYDGFMIVFSLGKNLRTNKVCLIVIVSASLFFCHMESDLGRKLLWRREVLELVSEWLLFSISLIIPMSCYFF